MVLLVFQYDGNLGKNSGPVCLALSHTETKLLPASLDGDVEKLQFQRVDLLAQATISESAHCVVQSNYHTSASKGDKCDQMYAAAVKKKINGNKSKYCFTLRNLV